MTRLDKIYVSSNIVDNLSSDIQPCYISDHDMVKIEVLEVNGSEPRGKGV